MLVLYKLSATVKAHIQKIWADGGYVGQLVEWVCENLNSVLEIVEKEPNQKGFRVLPRRLVVERTFAWFGRYRRLSKDYEYNPACSPRKACVGQQRFAPSRNSPLLTSAAHVSKTCAASCKR
jgi:transposase